jgi:hypothetical protein
MHFTDLDVGWIDKHQVDGPSALLLATARHISRVGQYVERKRHVYLLDETRCRLILCRLRVCLPKASQPHPAVMKWLSLALALAAPSWAYIRFGCATLSVQRLDPVVEVRCIRACQRWSNTNSSSQGAFRRLICTRQVTHRFTVLETITHKFLLM